MTQEQKLEEAIKRMNELRRLLEGHGQAIERHTRCIKDITRQVDQIMREAGLKT